MTLEQLYAWSEELSARTTDDSEPDEVRYTRAATRHVNDAIAAKESA